MNGIYFDRYKIILFENNSEKRLIKIYKNEWNSVSECKSNAFLPLQTSIFTKIKIEQFIYGWVSILASKKIRWTILNNP